MFTTLPKTPLPDPGRTGYAFTVIKSAEVAVGGVRLSGAAVELWGIIDEPAPSVGRLVGFRWRVTDAEGRVRVGAGDDLSYGRGPEWWPARHYAVLTADDGRRLEVAWSGDIAAEAPSWVG